MWDSSVAARTVQSLPPRRHSLPSNFRLSKPANANCRPSPVWTALMPGTLSHTGRLLLDHEAILIHEVVVYPRLLLTSSLLCRTSD